MLQTLSVPSTKQITPETQHCGKFIPISKACLHTFITRELGKHQLYRFFFFSFLTFNHSISSSCSMYLNLTLLSSSFKLASLIYLNIILKVLRCFPVSIPFWILHYNNFILYGHSFLHHKKIILIIIIIKPIFIIILFLRRIIKERRKM